MAVAQDPSLRISISHGCSPLKKKKRKERKKIFAGSSLAAQQVKDPALSLLWFGSVLWYGFSPWPQEILHALGMAPPKKEEKILAE